MSKHNRERRRLWRIGLTRRQLKTTKKLDGPSLQAAIAVKAKESRS